MALGTLRGWIPEVAAALWRRMLGILGDINDLTPETHAIAMRHLLDLSHNLIKVSLLSSSFKLNKVAILS